MSQRIVATPATIAVINAGPIGPAGPPGGGGGGGVVATTVQARAGTENTTTMTPLRVKEAAPFMDVSYFGAKCDDVTDDTVALNAALASGRTVVVNGTCKITDELVQSVSGSRLVGTSPFGYSTSKSRIKQYNTTGVPIIRMNNTRGAGISDISLEYATQDFSADAIAIMIDGIIGQADISNVYIRNAGVGIGFNQSLVGTHVFFASKVQNIRIDAYGVFAMDLRSQSGGGTGCHFDVIYTNAGGLLATPVVRGYSPVQIKQCHDYTFTGLHVEGVDAPRAVEVDNCYNLRIGLHVEAFSPTQQSGALLSIIGGVNCVVHITQLVVFACDFSSVNGPTSYYVAGVSSSTSGCKLIVDQLHVSSTSTLSGCSLYPLGMFSDSVADVGSVIMEVGLVAPNMGASARISKWQHAPVSKVNACVANYTLALTDLYAIIAMTSASATTLTVPSNASVTFPIGTKIYLVNYGAGIMTIAAAGGVTVSSSGSLLLAQNGSGVLYKTGTDQWLFTSGSVSGGTQDKQVFDTNASTPVVTADTVAIFGSKLAKRAFPAFVGPTGIVSLIQPLLANTKIGYWDPSGAVASVPGVFGYPAPVVTGFTATARTPTTTNIFGRSRRLGYVTSTTIGAVGQFRVNSKQITLGGGGLPTVGGFLKVVRFGISDPALVSDARMFMGISNNTIPTNVEPSTLLNHIGIGHGAADTTFHIYYGGSTAQTPINLGSNFPCNAPLVDVYELALFAPPNTPNTIHYQVTRLNTGHIATGTLTATTAGVELPDSTTLLTHQSGYRTNNSSPLEVGLDIISDYIETER